MVCFRYVIVNTRLRVKTDNNDDTTTTTTNNNNNNNAIQTGLQLNAWKINNLNMYGYVCMCICMHACMYVCILRWAIYMINKVHKLPNTMSVLASIE